MLDESEKKIIKELIKNPRISDNHIAKATNVPVMTVNRKRKKLEEENIISYCTIIRRGEKGIKVISSRALYIITLSAGITTSDYYKAIKKDNIFKQDFSSVVESIYLGEKSGHIAVMMVLETAKQSEQVEIFNGKVIPWFKSTFGKNSVRKITTVRINQRIKQHYNYYPDLNIKSGIIDSAFPDEYIDLL
ncbi:winged helix-turn-helix transcriptional regulator [Candidatus Woesearchaeota archaeon]|nr:winged helix-turn-helix transcriptional regulator [Candidatus Woesearchaeota archaeon]